MNTANTPATKCEIREGIGLCDECSLPKWPQRYMGYGFMVCLDCVDKTGGKVQAAKAEAERVRRTKGDARRRPPFKRQPKWSRKTLP